MVKVVIVLMVKIVIVLLGKVVIVLMVKAVIVLMVKAVIVLMVLECTGDLWQVQLSRVRARGFCCRHLPQQVSALCELLYCNE